MVQATQVVCSSKWLTRGQHGFYTTACIKTDFSGEELDWGRIWRLRLPCFSRIICQCAVQKSELSSDVNVTNGVTNKMFNISNIAMDIKSLFILGVYTNKTKTDKIIYTTYISSPFPVPHCTLEHCKLPRSLKCISADMHTVQLGALIMIHHTVKMTMTYQCRHAHSAAGCTDYDSSHCEDDNDMQFQTYRNNSTPQAVITNDDFFKL